MSVPQDRLAKALMVAIRAHAGQVDKQGEPYLLHVLRVVEAVSDEAKPVAALHDVVEDAGTHLEGARLATEADLNGSEYWALMALTRSETGACDEHDGGEDPDRPSYADYVAHIAQCGNPIAREVKLADLRDNLGRIPENPACMLCVGNDTDDAGNDLGSAKPCKCDKDWASLRRRYEKAIATLESVA